MSLVHSSMCSNLRGGLEILVCLRITVAHAGEPVGRSIWTAGYICKWNCELRSQPWRQRHRKSRSEAHICPPGRRSIWISFWAGWRRAERVCSPTRWRSSKLACSYKESSRVEAPTRSTIAMCSTLFTPSAKWTDWPPYRRDWPLG